MMTKREQNVRIELTSNVFTILSEDGMENHDAMDYVKKFTKCSNYCKRAWFTGENAPVGESWVLMRKLYAKLKSDREQGVKHRRVRVKTRTRPRTNGTTKVSMSDPLFEPVKQAALRFPEPSETLTMSTADAKSITLTLIRNMDSADRGAFISSLVDEFI